MEDQINTQKAGILYQQSSALKKGTWVYSLIFLFLISFFYSGTAMAASGKDIFKARCAVCHKTSTQKVVGPGLAGMNEKHSAEWLINWVKDSKALIESGDEAAKAIFDEYNQMPMTGFPDLSDEEITSIFAYIDEKNKPEENGAGTTTSTSETNNEVAPPASEPMDPTLFWVFLIFGLIMFYLYRMTRKVRELSKGAGAFPEAHAIKNYAFLFLLYLCAALVIIYALTYGLEKNIRKINGLLFAAFPYVAFAILLIGSIYRYTRKGFKVSSLSTQFLEGKKLFWGSQPFHWGLLVLFFGHLIAFLFPRAVLAWNGEPVRLLILEISSFAFAILALIGLVLLIKRRLSNKTLLVVSNKMDLVVYTVLLTQIVSGIGVAFFVRWGSSWFASVLTPYLRSIFSFSPDIAAISEAPLWVQIHVISAFTIIAIIPFSRFMHFLVAPIDYLWRRYQLVIWNWNRKAIRQSTRHTFGRKPRNH